MAEIIDIHAHTSLKKLAGLYTESATVETIEQEMAKNNVGTSVLMATYFPLKGTGVHNSDLVERIRGHPKLKMFGSLDMTADIDSGIYELRSLALEKKIIGIKLYPGYQDFSLSGKNAFKVYELASEFQLPVAIHTGDLHSSSVEEKVKLNGQRHLAYPSELRPVANAFRNLNFIAAHLSNPRFDMLFDLMSRCGNVYTDISGQLKTNSEEDTPYYRDFISRQLQRFIDHYPDRICFASDFPIQSLKTSLELVSEIKFNGNEDLFYCKNAKRIMEA